MAGETSRRASPSESPALYNLALGACQRAGFMPRVAQQEAVQLLTVLALVESGFCVSLIPESLTAKVRRRIAFRRLDNRDGALETGLGLLYAPERERPLLAHFREAVLAARGARL